MLVVSFSMFLCKACGLASLLASSVIVLFNYWQLQSFDESKYQVKSLGTSRCCESSSQVDVSARNLHSIESEVVVWLRF